MASMQVVGDVLRARAREHPDTPFWTCGDDHATYAEADARTDAVAAGLASLGLRHGDRVAVLSTNRWEMLEIIFACAKIGVIQVPLNAYLRGEFLRYQLDNAEPAVLLADALGVEGVADVLSGVPSLNHIIAFDPVPDVPLPLETLSYAILREAGVPPAVELSASDLVAIIHTSGTTGLPKGCMLPHGNYTNIGREVARVMGFRSGDVLFTALPLFHGAAQIATVMTALMEGLSVVVEPEFHVTTTIDRWIETGATVYTGMGMMGMAMLHLPSSDKDRAHKVHSAMFVPCPPEMQLRFLERFGVQCFAEGYGQTECAPVSLSPRGEAKVGSQGRPASYFDVQVVDEEDNILPIGEVGEIVVRPRIPNVMYVGYWHQAEATLESWRSLWHHTGDYARFDEDGFLYFIDRKKDALRRRGENISSVEVESAILKHPKILEAAVHPVPSEMTEEEVKACIVLGPGQTIEPKELFDFFRQTMPYFVVPRYVEVVNDLPRTAATMRVRKHILRERGITEGTWDFQAMGLTIEREERRR